MAASRLSTLSAATVGLTRQHARLGGQDGDGRDVLLRLVGHLGEQQRVDHQRPDDADAQRVPVGRRLGRRRSTGVAAGARPVLHHERRAEPLLQALGHDPGQAVGRRAGDERHDDGDRPRRPFLRAERAPPQSRDAAGSAGAASLYLPFPTSAIFGVLRHHYAQHIQHSPSATRTPIHSARALHPLTRGPPAAKVAAVAGRTKRAATQIGRSNAMTMHMDCGGATALSRAAGAAGRLGGGGSRLGRRRAPSERPRADGKRGNGGGRAGHRHPRPLLPAKLLRRHE